MTMFLGVDGGNTKTLAIVADEAGRVLGKGRAGNGDIYGAGSADLAITAIKDAVSDAIDEAGGPSVDFATFSLAGADWPEDYALLQKELGHLARSSQVVNDAYGALRAGTKDGVGVSLVCGTSGTCGAVGRTGKRWQGGFWHRGEGGAVTLGQATFQRVLDAELGLCAKTRLTRRVLDFYGSTSVEDLLHRLTGRATGCRSRDVALVPLLFEEALQGDTVAVDVIREHSERQAGYAVHAAKAVGLSGNFSLVLAGGVLRFRPNPLESFMIEFVRGVFPGAEPVKPQVEPLVGALLLSYDLAGLPVSPAIENNLLSTGPEACFFDSLG